MKTKAETKAWLLALEAERHDRSYLNPPKEKGPAEYTKIIYRDKPVDHRFRDNIMYHAGRYAEGARDEEAVNAHQIAGNLINQKGTK